jgi:hypothetical protein
LRFPRPAISRRRRVAALAALLVLVVNGPAAGEWQFTPFVGYTFKGSTTLVDLELGSEETHWNFGGSVMLIGDSPFGLEGYFVRTPGFFQNERTVCNVAATCITGSRTYALMGNAVLATPRRWNQYGLRPFVSGGLGLLHASRSDTLDIIPIQDLDMLGMNVGGGAVGLLTERIGVRFDLRYFRNVDAPDWTIIDPPLSIGPIRLRYWTTAIGVVIKY